MHERISTAELTEWAEKRADDAGRLARELVLCRPSEIAARQVLTSIKDRLETAFGAGVWDLPAPNPNGSNRLDYQHAALFSVIQSCKKFEAEHPAA